MTTPRKRPNITQRKITTFFPPTPSLAPAVPDSIQSSLLTVGMRVRKSVPEGYKSGSYAFNKHLQAPKVEAREGASIAKRGFEGEEEGEREEKKQALGVVSSNVGARKIAAPRVFWKAVKRRDDAFGPAAKKAVGHVKDVDVEMEEAGFLRPVDE